MGTFRPPYPSNPHSPYRLYSSSIFLTFMAAIATTTLTAFHTLKNLMALITITAFPASQASPGPPAFLTLQAFPASSTFSTLPTS
jgi:hypothetical protein